MNKSQGNHQDIVSSLLEEKKLSYEIKDASHAFEILVADLVLQNKALGYDDLTYGIVDGGGDGAIDSIYVFVDGTLCDPSTLDVNALKNEKSTKPHVEIYIIQSTTTKGFKQAKLDSLKKTVNAIFNPNDSYISKVNKAVQSYGEAIRAIIKVLALRKPNFEINIWYACFQENTEVHPDIKFISDEIISDIQKYLTTARSKFHFAGCDALYKLYDSGKITQFGLPLEGANETTQGDAYLILLPFKNHIDFLSDEDGNINQELFEANVRDYQGSVTVNKKIYNALVNVKEEDFWWLNNGVTIIADGATRQGGILTLESPSIVNGLQTSNEIFNYAQDHPDNFKADTRRLLVKVIPTASPEIQARVIEATNSQTPVNPASLRGLAPVHRQIEIFFESNGEFYERRKGYYKNRGKPRSLVSSITEVAQAVMAIALHKPSAARARPTSLLSNDATHEEVFSSNYHLSLYLNCRNIIRAAEKEIEAELPSFDLRNRNNIKFHVAATCAKIAGISSSSWPKADTKALIEQMKAVIPEVAKIYRAKGGTDSVAKNQEFQQACFDFAETFTK